MNIQLQALLLTLLILISVTLTKIGRSSYSELSKETNPSPPIRSEPPPNIKFSRATLLPSQVEVKKAPVRNWNVLDPKVRAEAVLVQSLDDNLPFFYLNTYKSWPLASLSKLLTALVVLEDIGENKKIPIDEAAVATEGEAGGLRSGEVYTARDLLKIMLLTSSNDAAAAFQNYLGPDEFLRILNQKVKKIGMNQTTLYDGSGLSDLNAGTASDLVRLVKYILENNPEIFNWSRISNQLVQPINNVESRIVYNINSLVNESYFLGGKIGASDKARENLLALVSLKDKRVVVILLGSPNRNEELKTLMDWVNKAYIF